MAFFNRNCSAPDYKEPFTIRIYTDGIQIVFVDSSIAKKHIYETIVFPWYLKWSIQNHIKKLPGLFPMDMFKIEKCPDKIHFAR